MSATCDPGYTASGRTSLPSAKSGGQPLRPADQSFFEAHFDRDFSRVRVHADRRAADAAEHLHARAFTRGEDIAFGAGHYRPETQTGRKLLAHELAHVVQGNPADTIYRQTDDDDAPANEDGPGLEKTVLFDAGQSWTHRVEEGLAFSTYALSLRKELEDAHETGLRVQITGYASIDESNAAELAKRRAEFVKRKLVEFQVPELLIFIESSRGADGTHAEAEKNQRVEIQVTRPDLPEWSYSEGLANSCNDAAEHKIEEAYRNARAILDSAIAKSRGGRAVSPWRVIVRVTNSTDEDQKQEGQESGLALERRRAREIRKRLEQLVPLAVITDTQANYTPPERDTSVGYADVSVSQTTDNDPDMLIAAFGPLSYAFEPNRVELKDEISFLSDSFKIQDFLVDKAVPDMAIFWAIWLFNIEGEEKAREALPQITADLMVIRSALDDARHFKCPVFCDANAKTGYDRDADIKFCPSGLAQEPLQLAETLIHELAHSQLKHRDVLYIDEYGSASHWGDDAGLLRWTEADLNAVESSILLKNADSLSTYAYLLATRDT
jgi:outer membrane protein OmpA-like peptidoglycan-associated protein